MHKFIPRRIISPSVAHPVILEAAASYCSTAARHTSPVVALKLCRSTQYREGILSLISYSLYCQHRSEKTIDITLG